MNALAQNVAVVISRMAQMCTDAETDAEMFMETFSELFTEACRDEDIELERTEYAELNSIQRNALESLRFLQLWSEHDGESACSVAEALDAGLDEINEMDGFGTEGQCDPRGDFRTRQWTLWNVEGGVKVKRS